MLLLCYYYVITYVHTIYFLPGIPFLMLRLTPFFFFFFFFTLSVALTLNVLL